MHLSCREDFNAYANVCFHEFGDRVAHWTTMLQPNALAQGAYDIGELPPNHCSYPFGSNCAVGNSTTEPYLFVHHSLLAHASTVNLYRKKYKVSFPLSWLLFPAKLYLFELKLNPEYCLWSWELSLLLLFSISGCTEGHYWTEFAHHVVLSIHRFQNRHWSNWKSKDLLIWLVCFVVLKAQLSGHPHSWIMAQEFTKFLGSCIRWCSETVQRLWGRLLVCAFHPSPAMNLSLLLTHLTSLDWITTLHIRAIVLTQ